MKRILIFFLIIQTGLLAQNFEVTIDTLNLDIREFVRPVSKVELSHIIKFQDKYYCFFQERGLYYFQRDTRFFLIISNDGRVLKHIDIPNQIKNSNYFDFFQKRDSLFLKSYMNHETFYFDNIGLEWNKTKETDDIVYEDDEFKIAYLDFGEWGETTWFIDKKNNKEYILGTSGTNVNIIDNKYYLTNGFKVEVVNDPHKLEECDEQEYYEFIRNKKGFKEGTFSLLGSKNIYRDTTYSPFSFEESNQRILTSFVYENQLFQLFNDINSTHIGVIENKELVSIQKLGRKFNTYNWYYSYRGNNLNNNSRLLKFKEDNNTFGTIEINNNKIDIHFMKHNIDSLNYLGKDGFDDLLHYSISKMDNLSLDKTDSIERLLQGTDMQIVRQDNFPNGYFPDKILLDINESKKYIKVEDDIISLTSEYYYAIPNNLVKSIFLEWTVTQPYTSKNYSFRSSAEEKVVTERFKSKLKEIIGIVNSQTNIAPLTKFEENNYVEWIWESDSGETIHLYGSNTFNWRKEIRLVIFKE